MHEESLVRSLLQQVDMLVEQHGGGCVQDVEVEIGPLSGIEALLLESAFERLTAPLDRAPRLIVHQVPLVVACQDCHREFSLADFRFVCHHCDSRRLQVLRGDGMILKSVVVQIAEGVPEVCPRTPCTLDSIDEPSSPGHVSSACGPGHAGGTVLALSEEGAA
jgi:hydrogenase nickel incorporation protein HypA/HybF